MYLHYRWNIQLAAVCKLRAQQHRGSGTSKATSVMNDRQNIVDSWLSLLFVLSSWQASCELYCCIIYWFRLWFVYFHLCFCVGCQKALNSMPKQNLLWNRCGILHASDVAVEVVPSYLELERYWPGVDWKWRTWKWRTIKIAGHEIAGHEKDGPNSRAWKCRTWKWRTK